MIWYGNTNHLKVGPVNVGDQLGNNANWEPYCGVLGDSAFLLGYCSYARDGVANPATAPRRPRSVSASAPGVFCHGCAHGCQRSQDL